MSKTDELRDGIAINIWGVLYGILDEPQRICIDEIVALIKAHTNKAVIEGKLKQADYLKSYMANNSPFVEEILQPEIDSLTQQLKDTHTQGDKE